MGQVRRIFTRIRNVFSRRAPRPQHITGKLDAQALEKVMQEARFLQSRHAVDVRSLQPGEEPGQPRRADEES